MCVCVCVRLGAKGMHSLTVHSNNCVKKKKKEMNRLKHNYPLLDEKHTVTEAGCGSFEDFKLEEEGNSSVASESTSEHRVGFGRM